MAESRYERRIRRYQELHPGASRQEARGHRLPAGTRSEYARRTEGARPEDRRARSGHAGPADLIRFLRPGDEIILERGIASVETAEIRRRETVTVSERVRIHRAIHTVVRKRRRVVTRRVFVEVVKLVRPADNRPDRSFTIRNYTWEQMEALIRREEEKGATWSPRPSLDQRKLVGA